MLHTKVKKLSKKIEITGLGACWYGVCTNVGDQITTYSGLVATTKQVLDFLIGVSGLVAVIILVYGGVMFITSAGESDKVEKATNIIKYAIMGLILVFISVMIVNFVYDVVL